jgi:uncharacterized protein (DUF1330 family)
VTGALEPGTHRTPIRGGYTACTWYQDEVGHRHLLSDLLTPRRLGIFVETGWLLSKRPSPLLIGERRTFGHEKEDDMSPEGVEKPIAYVISSVEGFGDVATVKRYGSLAGSSIEQYGGRFVVSNIEPEIVEGESPSRHLSVVEFPSIEHARTWYDSPEYAAAREITPEAFVGRVLMFAEGITGPRVTIVT